MADATPDVAYLTRLALIEGHMIAATTLYAPGMTDEAVGLAGDPKAEMIGEVRETLATRRAQDFSDALKAVGEGMAEGTGQAQVIAAQDMANSLAQSDDETVATAAAKIAAALAPAIAQFGDVNSPNLTIGDASVLHGAAAQVKLAALRIK